MGGSKKHGHDDLLSSWKAIANYLRRGVRTIQRWELELGLPVRRPAGKRRSAVIAFRSEVDEWLKSCPQELLMVQKMSRRRKSRRPARDHAIYEHLNRARVLQEEVLNSVAGLSRSIEQLYVAVNRLRGSRSTESEPEELKPQVIPKHVNGKPPQALT